MPCNHLIFCYLLLLLPTIFPSIRVFSNESVLRIRWPKYWSFSFNISPPNEYSGLISFGIDWFDHHAVNGTLESSPTPQFKSINSSVLIFLYSPTLTSIHDCWGPLMDRNLVVWSQPIRSKGERKRLIFLGLHRKPIKSLTRGLLCSWRPQAPSWWGEGTEHLLERVLEAQAGKWTQRASGLQGISLKERERQRQRETEKARHRDQSYDGAEMFYSTLCIYTVLQDSYFQQR